MSEARLLCLQETSSRGSKRRKTKGGEREREGVGEEEEEEERGERTVPRGSLHQHHIGGSDKEEGGRGGVGGETELVGG